MSCTPQQLLIIGHNNPKLQYTGRIAHTDSAAVLYWPGSAIRIDFEGTEVQAMLKDEKGENYYYVIVDSTDISKFKPDSAVKKLYTLVSHLRPGKHSLQLVKLTEAADGNTLFYYFGLQHDGVVLNPPPPPQRKIEFYGNSITCGYAVEDEYGDSKEPKYRNNYLSYAAITARHYNAEAHYIAKSGIGLMLSWFPIIMPEMYSRLNPSDSNSKWDFSQFTPQIVVINLLQNDSWLIKKHDFTQFKARFGTTTPDEAQIINAYKSFITTIRSKYPRASIICALGSMDATKEGSPWPGYIQKAVTQLKDPAIYTCFFPYIHTNRHPKIKEQEAMADTLTHFIDTHIKW